MAFCRRGMIYHVTSSVDRASYRMAAIGGRVSCRESPLRPEHLSMSTSKESTQPSAERRTAEAQVQLLINTFSPSHEQLVAASRRVLRKRVPTSHEVVYEYRDCFVISFSPSGHGYEGVLALRASEEGVRLCFNYGKQLPDPAKLLKGSGSQVRWMSIESAATFKRPEVSRLIDQAIEQNPVPFAAAGRGSVVVRLTTAAKRTQKKPAARKVAAVKTPRKRVSKTKAAKRRS